MEKCTAGRELMHPVLKILYSTVPQRRVLRCFRSVIYVKPISLEYLVLVPGTGTVVIVIIEFSSVCV